MLDTYGRKYADVIIEPGARFAEKIKATPTKVTVAAFVTGVASALFFTFQAPAAIPLFLLWFSGYLDTVDGALARRTGKASKTGTLLDIFFDRVVEMAFFIAFAFRSPDSLFSLLLAASSIVLSISAFLTSAALLENTGKKTFRYQTGIMERTEGFILFSVMMIFISHLAILAYIYAALVFLTAIQRVILTILELKGK